MDLQVIGMGEQAGVRLRSLLEKTDSPPSQGLNRPAGLLLLGVAGAVDPGLETGDLVLSARYYRQDSDENSPLTPTERQTPNSADPTATGTDFLAPDPDLWQWATAAGEDTDKPVVFADSLTVNDLVATPWDKQAIGDRYPVGIVNMEDYRVAAVAQEAGVPFISARAILDPTHQILPSYLSGLAGSPGKVLPVLLAKPWRVPTLVGLARQLGTAQRALTGFALSFLTQVSYAEPAIAYGTAGGASDWRVTG